MATELVSMSRKEIDRLDVIRRVVERRLTQVKAAQLMGLGPRQVGRLCAAYERHGPAGLVSQQRGKASNRRLPEALQARALDLVRERYADFGPTLAREKLRELHDVDVARETLRKWMAGAGIWLTRDKRRARAHQPRHRRACLGELVQIDGSPHAWFEDRGPECSLLVYVDDATGTLMELQFVEVESTFDYFASTVTYLKRHGKPVAFYSDKHSIFRLHHQGATGRAKGLTQFGRALSDLNIDIICANTPQAKGRVERMNKTLQDRLVKELRLRNISNMDDGNAFLPEFMADYNRRFARVPQSAHDAHRPLQAGEDLVQTFSWQEERTMSRNLTVHFKRVTYLIDPGPETLPLGGKRVQVREWEDGRVEIQCAGRTLPYSIFDKNPHVAAGAIVENKRLGAVLAVIQAVQVERDRTRLASKKLTIRQKDRIRAAGEASRAPALPTSGAGTGAVAAFLDQFEKDQKERAKAQSLRAAQRREERAQALSNRTFLLGRNPDISTWR
jgi:Helix-turn-helix domain